MNTYVNRLQVLILKGLPCTKTAQGATSMRVWSREGGTPPYFSQRVRIRLIAKYFYNHVLQKSV